MNKKAIPLGSRKKGFTLLEIMIVVAIIGLLATIAIFATGSTLTSSKAKSNHAALVLLQQNAERFIVERGEIPAEWGNGASGATMTADERLAFIECISGIYAGSNAALATYSRNNPTYNLRTSAAIAATRFRALVVPSTTSPRVIILQYRDQDTGVVVNGNKTVAGAFLADATAVSGPDYFNDAAITGLSGYAAWPF